MILTNMIRWICLVLVILPGHVDSQSGADVNTLMTQLFTTNGYNKKIRPLDNQTDVMDIAVDFFLTSVIEFDEQNEALKTSGYLELSWTDNYMDWDPASYNNIQEIFVPQDDIWKPDVSLRNSYKSFTGLGSSYLNIKVASNGFIYWKPFQVLESTCSVDITYFPFDSQRCQLKFVAWSYNKDEVNLNQGNDGMVLSEYEPHNQWEITSTSASETNTYEASVHFSMILKRKPSFYVINVIIPIVLLTVLNCCTFILPVASGERAGYAITVFLSLAVFLTIVASELPKNSENTSLLGIYLTMMTSLSTTIVILCLIQVRISTWTTDEGPICKPLLIVHKIKRFLTCKTCKKRKVSDDSDIKKKKVPESRENGDNVTWVDIANALDFIFFWFCMLFTFICTLVIFVVASSQAGLG